jgi:hypothetical protein
MRNPPPMPKKPERTPTAKAVPTRKRRFRGSEF